MTVLHRIHLRPWLLAGRSLLPRPSRLGTNVSESTMNVFGLKVSLEREGSRARLAAPVVVAATVTALALGGGVAYAFWNATGSGSGSSKAGSATALGTVSATAATTGLLYPGASGDVKVTFDNPNPYAVKITSVSGNGAVSVSSAGTGACVTTGVSFTNQTGLNLTVPAKSGSTDGQLTTTLSAAVSMSNSSDDGCQTATFSVPISFAGASN